MNSNVKNFVLLFAGLYVKELRFLCYVRDACYFLITLRSVVSYYLMTKLSLVAVMFTLHYVCLIITRIVLICKSEAICQLANSLFKNLNIEYQNSLLRFAKLLVCLTVYMLIFKIAINVVLFFSQDVRYILYRIFCIEFDDIKFYHVMFGVLYLSFNSIFDCWSFQGITLCLYFVMLFYNCEKSFIEEVSKLKVLTSDQITKIYKFRRQIATLKSQFNDYFNVLPLLWYTYVFFAMSSYTVYFKINVQNILVGIFTTMDIGQQTISTMIVPILISHFNDQISEQLEHISHIVVNSKGDTVLKVRLINQLENCDLKLTGWGLFNVNKDFVLNFVSAVISFSVLILQITTN